MSSTLKKLTLSATAAAETAAVVATTAEASTAADRKGIKKSFC